MINIGSVTEGQRNIYVVAASIYLFWYQAFSLPTHDFLLLSFVQNDKIEFLTPGSLQHNGENMLAFLLHAASSPKFMEDAHEAKQESVEQKKAIFFDILV